MNGIKLITLLCMTALGEIGVMASSGHFRGGKGALLSKGSSRTVATREVETSIQDSLESLLGGGRSGAADRLAKIETSMWQTFQALPKNAMGRLEPRSVRYIVHNYFAKEHGWLIKGLEPHGMQTNMTELHDVRILQDKAPSLVESALEQRRAGRGLSLEDTVAMAAALERLIFDESVSLLKASYDLNTRSATDKVDETALHEILTSYLLLFEMGLKGDASDVQRHQAMKEIVASQGSSWQSLLDFEQDAVRNYGYARRHGKNPFHGEARFSFEEASHIVENLAEGYGKWQNMECRQMKEDLMEMDPDGSGRVPLSTFYKHRETADYQFSESTDYLRTIGALDESVPSAPRVRIANYVMGPSNCIASSSYYSVCCLSDCETLMNDLESRIKGPSADPEQLLSAVHHLPHSLTDVPTKFSQSMEDKLYSIADKNGGVVPLHGRLFAQWLHYAFPNECPYPHIAEDAAVLTPSHWMDKNATAAHDERKKHAEVEIDAEEEALETASEWSEHEILPLHELPKRRSNSSSDMLRLVMQIALCVVVVRIAYGGLRTAARGVLGKGFGKSKDDSLPFYA